MKKLLITAALAMLIAGCAAPKQAPVTIVNDLGAWDIVEIYIDKSADPWGSNRIPNSILTPGESVVINVPIGQYDIRIVDEDGDPYTRWNVQIPIEGYTWNVTLAHLD